MTHPTLAGESGRRHRRSAARAPAALLALLFVAAQVAGGLLPGGRGPRAEASPSISQIYFTPYEAQEYLDILRVIAGNPGCCSGPLISTISITSGATGNTVVYDHFEDGYEIDPYNPVQGSTITLAMDDGAVWTQTSSIPVDQPGRGAGFFYDGRDRIVSSAPIAVTQTAYATTPGTLHAGAVEVLDLDKSGTAFDIPVGENADYNSVFEYVGLMIVGNQRGTAVQVDADADGSFEITAALDEGETRLVAGGVNLGARVVADHPVAVYVLTGDIGATYEGRDFELYPTAVWSSQVVSPVGAHSSDAADGTRVFLFNPGAAAVVVDVETSAGAAGTVNLAPRGQGSFLVPVDQGARFTARGGALIYGFQAITTEAGAYGDATAYYDWGFSLIPVDAATTSVIVPFAPGSGGLTQNYSPVWITTFSSTTLYVDRDGDRSTGANVDPHGDHYDFSCAVTGLRSYTIYDDGTTNCYPPSQDSAAGGDRDMTGARIYTVDDTRLVAAWGQRSSYVAGSPALDSGTTILPFPSISMAKSSSVVGDADGDGRADPGDTVAYSITMTNLGIIDVGAVLLTDETPEHSAYVPGSTTLDGVPQADDAGPHSLSPVDADSPAGGLGVGTIAAGATRTAVFRVVIDDPLPFGVGSLLNLATMTTSLGNASAVNLLPLDAGLQIEKAADPGPVDPGDTIEYTIRVFNGAAAQETGVSLTDVLPAGVTFVPGSAAGDLNGTPVAVGVPPILVPALTMPRGSLLTVGFRVTVDDPLPRGTLELVNAASTSSDQTPGPLTDDATTEVTPVPEPVVTKSPAPASLPEPGGTVTFTVSVGNPSGAAVTLTALTDDVFGDLRDADNAAVANNTCPAQPDSIAAGGTFTCWFEALVTGGAGGPDHVDTVQAVVRDGGGSTFSSTDEATVTFTDVPPALSVTKLPSPSAVTEPGAVVTFAVEVENLSIESVTLTSLADDVFGDLLDRDNPAVEDNTCPAQSTALPPAGALSCSFRALVAGDFGDPAHHNTVTAGASDDEGNSTAASAEAAVVFSDLLPSLAVAKTPSAGSVGEPGGMVTFGVEVANTSAEPVTLISLSDDVFGDLLDGANPAVSSNTCPAGPLLIPAESTLDCSFAAYLAGDAGEPNHVDTVTAVAADDEGNLASAADDAVVVFGDVVPTIEVDKRADPGRVPEPGASAAFHVTVHNTGLEAVTLTSLGDDVFGDLLDAANPLVSGNTCPDGDRAIPAGGQLACSFEAFVAGDAGGPDHADTVTATVEDDEGNPASADAGARVAFDDVLPSLRVAKTAAPSTVEEPGGIVTFLISVENTSVEEITLTSLADSVFGDLRDAGNPAVFANTCAARPAAIPSGGTLTCSFEGLVAGEPGGGGHVDTVTAEAVDDEGHPVSAGATATVSIMEADAVVTGHLFVDLDGDRAQGPGEPHLSGVQVRLVDGEGGRQTVISDALGDWEAPVPAGVVGMRVVAATVPAGYRLTTANAVQTVTAPPGSAIAVADVGYRPADGSLSGKVFFDVDDDEVQGVGEPAFAGVAVSLYHGGRLLGTVLTEGDGSYLFDDLTAGEYRVVVRDDADRFAGFAATLDPDGTFDGETAVVLGTSEDRGGVDFAYRGTGSVGDTVWNDADGDQVQDAAEARISGASLGLVWSGFDGVLGSADDVAFPAQATGAAGTYLFTGVPPGVILVAADPASVDGGFEPTTSVSYTYDLHPGEGFLDGDVGFREQTELPYTGFDADLLGFLSLGLIAVGLALLTMGRRGRAGERLRWDRLR